MDQENVQPLEEVFRRGGIESQRRDTFHLRPPVTPYWEVRAGEMISETKVERRYLEGSPKPAPEIPVPVVCCFSLCSCWFFVHVHVLVHVPSPLFPCSCWFLLLFLLVFSSPSSEFRILCIYLSISQLLPHISVVIFILSYCVLILFLSSPSPLVILSFITSLSFSSPPHQLTSPHPLQSFSYPLISSYLFLF